jgi:hypothetical protein
MVATPDVDLDDIPERPFPTYDRLSHFDCLVCSIARCRAHMQKDHLIPNTPFVLSSQATQDWPCNSWRLRWDRTNGSGPSKPNLSALRQFAYQVVPVANTLQREFSEFERDERLLGEVLDLWENGEGEGLYVKVSRMLRLCGGSERLRTGLASL